MGFQQGLSGLRAASTSLNVIGTNVSNASTVGYKSSITQFADMYARSLTNGTGTKIGMGTTVANVQTQFTQGPLSATSNSLDVAINGNGFFRFVTPDGQVAYSRNGQLELTKEGYLINSAGYRLTEYPSGNEIIINQGDMGAKATETVTKVLNLDASETSPTTLFPNITPPSTTPDSTSYNFKSTIEVYDSLGVKHDMELYYVKAPAPAINEWTVFAYIDGVPIDSGNGYIGALQFDTDGKLSALVPNGSTALTPDGLGFDLSGWGFDYYPAPGTADTLGFSIDFSGATQYGNTSALTDNQQDGYTSGSLLGFVIDDSGYIVGVYSNDQNQIMSQVALANFINLHGLEHIGDNMYVETMYSGAPILGTAGTGSFGVLQSYYVEESNVDLTAELVDMIIAQRVYQANAQTISTQDQILQTIVNLR